MTKAILRQVKDLQIQAETLCTGSPNLHDFEHFSSYSEEIKSYLIKNIKEEMILKYVNEIPVLDLDKLETSQIHESILMSLLNGVFGFMYRERLLVQKAQNIARDIRGKYGSIEFLLKNYFD